MMPDSQMGNRLDSLFREYRDACPDPEAGRDFMPELWAKIDARRSFAFKLPLLAKRFATAAVAICTLLALLLLTPFPQNSVFTTGSYVDVLSDEEELMAYADVDHPDPAGDSATR